MAERVEHKIYEAVFDAVMGQRLPPGTKLPEAALCALFNASRSMVRKVLERLAHDHIVDLRPNRGAIVAVPEPQETHQLFEARRGIEAAVVRLVAGRLEPAELTELRDRLRQEHDAMHNFDQPAWARLASSFHVRLGELADNPILLRFLTELVSRCSLVVALYEPPGNATCEHGEHEAIVNHLDAGDADAAVAAMDAHLHKLESNLRLDRGPGAPTLAHMLGLS